MEIAVHNDIGSVCEYMNHWEGRALKAEAERAAAPDLLAALKRVLTERDEYSIKYEADQAARAAIAKAEGR